jgi:hypothetical protein
MSKDNDSKTEHVPGPPILGGVLGGGDYWKTTITEGDGSKTKGFGSTPEESQKDASKNHK